MTGFDVFAATLRRFQTSRSGATAIEYAMIAAGIGAAVATTVMALGSTVSETFYDRLTALF